MKTCLPYQGVEEQLSHGAKVGRVFRTVICRATGHGSGMILCDYSKSQLSRMLYNHETR
jgi:hypothetical protein